MPCAVEERISFEGLRDFCHQAYMKAGVPEDEAFIVSDLLARSDLRGVESHGVTRLPIYILRLQKGYVRKKVELTYIRDKGPVALAEAHGSMGHVVSHLAMQAAIEKAGQFGIGWISVKDSGHFGVTGLFPMMAAEVGLIGYTCSNSAPMMAPYGGRERILGNNPLAYAFPANDFPSVVVDFSCSVVASGRLIVARKKGEKIPLGWAVDKDGLPTEDPYEGYEGGGALFPVGAHKGYGLALAHEILTAVLIAGKWTRSIRSLYEEDESRIQGTCHSFMALDPDCFIGRDEFKKEMDRYIKSIKESGKARDVDEILIPGEPEFRTETERLREGIPLAPNTVKELTELGQSLGLSLQLMDLESISGS